MTTAGRRGRTGALLAALVTAAATLAAPTAGVAAAELPPGGTFADDDGGPFEGWIEAVHAAGITDGCAPDRFCPTEPVTRGQLAALVVAAAELPPSDVDAFVDDDGGPFETAIDALAASSIVGGCEADTGLGASYCPTRSVTRGQVATVLVGAFGLGAPGAPDAFSDDDGTLHEADIDRLSQADVTTGCGASRYCPGATLTRGQFAALLGTVLGLSPESPPVRSDVPGNPDGAAAVPTEADRVDTSRPDRVIGTGTPASCTDTAVVAAVARGGLITFDCGPAPVTIRMRTTAKVVNDADDVVVLDGGGLVTLDGGGDTRILYMNTCDPAQVWTTSHCQDQDHPRLTVQGLHFTGGWDVGTELEDGGGAVWARGGRLRIVDSRFTDNNCSATGPDVGGGAVRAFSQSEGRPVHVTRSTFGGADGLGNACSNGGALSSIGVTWHVRNSVLTHNSATGVGANPARAGTPGGGNGGAIALDGNTFRLRVLDSVITDNVAPEGGGGIFFVSNDRSGTMELDGSVLRRNPSLGFETAGYPGIFFLGAEPPTVTETVLE